MKNTDFEDLMEKMKERILTIKKGNICHINNQEYDITINSVLLNPISLAEERSLGKGCRLSIEINEGKVGEHFGNYRIETYNVTILVDYNRHSEDDEDIFTAYKNHLFTWIYLLMSDDTDEINDFWTQAYSKPSMMKMSWKLIRQHPKKTFKMEIYMNNVQIRTNRKNIFNV